MTMNDQLTYSLTNDPEIVQRSDGLFIPNDPGNADWREYQAWLAAGNEPAPAPASPAAPATKQDQT
jgi:hypothetical protein